MSAPRIVEPVIRFCAVISRHEAARRWAVDRLAQAWGAAAEISPPLPFEANGFYQFDMGDGLVKEIVAIDGVADPSGLADWKLETNRWEDEYRTLSKHDELRPLNLDPGYITQAKLVLATVKDRDHRLYLHDGIFAEVTLNYVAKKWVHHRWTYPDYRTEEVASFAMMCRKRLRSVLQQSDQWRRVNVRGSRELG